MKKTRLVGTVAVLTAAIMAGCNSNDDDGSKGAPTGATGPSTTSLTVSPSLGAISNARVILRNARNRSPIGSPQDLNGGSVTFNDVPVGIPVIAEVVPRLVAGVPQAITYFDEGADNGAGGRGANRTISGADLVNFNLRAALPAVTPGIVLGVTAFTEAAMRNLGAGNLTPEQIAAANAAIRTQLRNANLIPDDPEFDITDAPLIVDANADLAGLANDIRSRYAALLAIYANAVSNHSGHTHPALLFLNDLSADLEDGLLDGSTEGINFNGEIFEASFRQAALGLNSLLPASMDTLINGITFSGGGATGGDFGSVTIDGDLHNASFASVVTVNGQTTYTWSDGMGSLSLMVNSAGVPQNISVFTPESAASKSCAANACSGITVSAANKNVTFSNVTIPSVNQVGQSITVSSGTLKTEINSNVSGSFTVQSGLVTAADIATLQGSYTGAGVLLTSTAANPGTPSNVNCSASINSSGQMSVSGGGFSITVAPNNLSVVSNTQVVVNGQTMTFRSVTLAAVGNGSVGTATVVFDNAGKMYTIAGTRTNINLQNPLATSTTLLTCSAIQ